MTHEINETDQANRRTTAIVTGAARGIGAAVAKRLARDGLAIGVIDLRKEDCAGTVEAIASRGGSAIAAGADVADEAAVTAAVERVTAELGPPISAVGDHGRVDDGARRPG